ncbi:MAG: hypothetical protein RQM92_09480 [Candidatus Syntrophopropionicum ammoniitolerans]
MPEFIEKLKPKLACSSIKPKWAKTVPDGMPDMMSDGMGGLIELANDDRRQFLTGVLRRANNRDVLDVLYNKTAYVILLVRERLERERPYEVRFEVKD